MDVAKRYLYPFFAAILVVVFLFMTGYSLWCGAKNADEVVCITDTYSKARNEGTKVYHHSYLENKNDINVYHGVIEDSLVLRFSGVLSKFINPLYVWSILNILSVIFIILMFFSLVSRSDSGVIRFLLTAILAFVPVFFRGAVAIGDSAIIGALLLLMVYIGCMKDSSVIKWYLIMALCAVVVSSSRGFVVLAYLIPFVAYSDIKRNYNGGKAASHILILLLCAFVIHFMFLRAFVDYASLSSALLKEESTGILAGLKNFFVLDTKEKIGIYLPINIMAIISFLGIFFVEKYVRKYIYPGVFLYFIVLLFMGGNAFSIAKIYPVLFFSFSITVIHMKIFRKTKIAVVSLLCVLLFVSLVCDGVISYKNHIKGMYVSEYTNEYAVIYDEYIGNEKTVLVIDQENNLFMQMYAAYPRKTILSPLDDMICPKIIGTYYPEYIVSPIELNYLEYENILSSQNQSSVYIYRLKK